MSDSGNESISELVKSLESAFFPSDYRAVEEKLLAREATLRRENEKLKRDMEELSNHDNVFDALVQKIWRAEQTRLNEKVTELTAEKEELEAENAVLRREYEELEKRMVLVEKLIEEIKAERQNGVNGEMAIPSQQKVKRMRSWEEFLYTPSKASQSPLAAKVVNGEGTPLEIIDSDDGESALSKDLTGKESGAMKIPRRNSSLQINGEKTTESLKRGGSAPIDLTDEENDEERLKFRKLGARSVRQDDSVVLDKCQEKTGMKSVEKGAARDVRIKGWKFDVDMLADFSKDDELCLRAVCALHRRQKLEGSSANDSSSERKTLIDFLTDGDPQGRLRRSVAELQKFKADLIQDCRQIAIAHFNELFQIYLKMEDPFFPRS